MSGPTREQALQLGREAGFVRNKWGLLEASSVDVERLVALAYAAGQAAERDARIKAQEELAACREAMTRAEHEAQRARGDLAVAVAAEGRCISHSDPRSFWHPDNKRARGQS